MPEIATSREEIRRVEDTLVEQGIKLFPLTRAGERARSIWQLIKPRLLRGRAVKITPSGLGLEIHRQELKRARGVLIDMELLKLSADGRYVLGSLGPCGRIDEMIRDEFLDLKLLESLVLLLSSIGKKSKTQKKRRRSQASQNSRCHD